MLKLRYHQQQAYDNFFEHVLNHPDQHSLIVLPTGGGKSLVQAYIVKKMLTYEKTRVLLLTHDKTLIEQNYAELVENFNHELFLDIGINCAGLKSRDTENRILFATIQSVYKKAWHLGWFDLILIDEAHLVNAQKTGMYRQFFVEMERINPKVIIGGLTATEYRMKSGLLTEGDDALFDTICHKTTIRELIDPNDIRNLDKEQYLCKLISKNALNKVDLSNVHTQAGEYVKSEMENAFIQNNLVEKAVLEIIKSTKNRKKVLIFTAGIKHCEEVHAAFKALGINAAFSHSKQDESINEKNLQDFQNGKVKYFLNVDKFTTGFNEKGVDCIAILRSMKSVGLFVQICGRGLRMFLEKEDCLILDFGRNLDRFGPLDKIEIKKAKKGEKTGTIPQKECPKCNSPLHLSIMECPDCGYLFPERDKHEEEASEANILSEYQKPKNIKVTDIMYSKHEKKGKPPSLKVNYYYDMFNSYSEWVCLEHQGFAKRKADKWVAERVLENVQITTVDDALEHCFKGFREPIEVTVDFNRKYPEIIGFVFEENKKKDGLEQENHEKMSPSVIDEKLEGLMY